MKILFKQKSIQSFYYSTNATGKYFLEKKKSTKMNKCLYKKKETDNCIIIFISEGLNKRRNAR